MLVPIRNYVSRSWIAFQITASYGTAFGSTPVSCGPSILNLRIPAYSRPASTSSKGSSTPNISEGSRVYVDGSSVKAKNGYRVGGAGVFWGDEDPRNLAHPILSVRDEEGRNIEVTNNRAELVAALMAVQRARKEGITRLQIITDSELVSKAMTAWIKTWMNNGWKNSSGEGVLNKRLYLALWVASRRLESVEWKHVRGHAGDEGNEKADQLATQGSLLARNMVDSEAEGGLVGNNVYNNNNINEDCDSDLEDDNVGHEPIDEETLQRILEQDSMH